jgi:endoglucanase
MTRTRPRDLASTLSLTALLATAPATAQTPPTPKSSFEVHRGTNVSEWLSQSARRGKERQAWFTRADVERIKSLGFDHVRLPVDEEQLWDSAGKPDAKAFGLLDSALDWVTAAGLRAIVDLHTLRAHHFDAKARPLWTEPAAQERFLQCWRDLSTHLGTRPVEGVAYELMNEPVADDPEQWNRLIARAVRVLREAEPRRVIVIGSNRWQSTDTFDALRVPTGDPNLLLSFHFYEPFALTHHKASWSSIKSYAGPVRYPGIVVEEKDTAGLDRSTVEALRGSMRRWDRDELERRLAKPLAQARETGLPLYCGEWGALPSVPPEDRLRWYHDLRSVLETHGIAWANWDWKGGFGIVSRDGHVDEGLVQALLR